MIWNSICTVRAPVFGRHRFFGTSEHYGKAHGSLLSGWMNCNYTACCWFPTSSNILILPSQFWQFRFEVAGYTVQSAEYWCFYGTIGIRGTLSHWLLYWVSQVGVYGECVLNQNQTIFKGLIIIIIHVSCIAHITFFLKSLCTWTPQTLDIREKEEQD